MVQAEGICIHKDIHQHVLQPQLSEGVGGSGCRPRQDLPPPFARGRSEYRGVTYHFLTEEFRQAFEQDPTRYVGGS